MTAKQKDKPVTVKTAVPKKAPASNKFEGNVVRFSGNKLMMTNAEGKKYSHTLAKDAKITSAGSACKAEDLKAGSKIRVTTNKNNRSVATSVEALD